jgi:protein-tyrosine phosphatase
MRTEYNSSKLNFFGVCSLDVFELKSTIFTDRITQYRSNPSPRIAISSVRNFRELGGYRTVGGQSIRPGLLYRSGHLHNMSAADLRRLEGLGVKRIIDFRSDLEKKNEPDRLPVDPNLRMVDIPILDSSTNAALTLERQIKGGRVDGIHPEKLFAESYAEMAARFTPQYREFIHELLDEHGLPVLFHCTAGKDRTGFAAAVLLRILGVPPETVMFDYLLSNEYYFKHLRRSLILLSLVKGRKISRIIAGFLEAKPSYLATAFQTLDRQHGSFDEYVRQGLDLTREQIDHLRLVYLQ